MDNDAHMNCDSDSSDDLPDIFDNDTDSPEKPFEIHKDDIVWAEYRQLHWPALVRKVDKKKRQISVWYLDSPQKCFKLTYGKILSFSSAIASQAIRKKAAESPVRAVHERVLSWTLSYIRRNSSGIIDNPAAYFDSTKPYLSFLNFKYDDESKGKLNPLTKESLNFASNNSLPDSEDEESDVDSEAEESNLSNYTVGLDDFSSACPDSTATAIVSCIKAGHTDRHLLDVRKRKIPSERHDLFLEAMKLNKKQLMWGVTPNIQIKDLCKLKAISTHLMDLYEKRIEGGKCEMLLYVTSVWLPEAIDKAASLIESNSVSIHCSEEIESSLESDSLGTEIKTRIVVNPLELRLESINQTFLDRAAETKGHKTRKKHAHKKKKSTEKEAFETKFSSLESNLKALSSNVEELLSKPKKVKQRKKKARPSGGKYACVAPALRLPRNALRA